MIKKLGIFGAGAKNVSKKIGKDLLEKGVEVAGSSLSSVSETGGKVLGRAKSAGGTVLDTAGSIAVTGKDVGVNIVEGAWELSKDGVSTVIALPGNLKDMVVKEVDVDAIIIPNGTKLGRHLIVFDFDEMIRMTCGGVLVSPRIKLWAASPDLDRAQVSAEIKEQFVTQLGQVADRKKQELEEQKRQLENQQKGIVGSLIDKIDVVESAIFLLTVVGTKTPFAPLILLGTALGKSDLTTGILRMAGNAAVDFFKDRRDSSAVKQIEKEAKSKEKEIDEAILNITIHVHPILKKLYLIQSQQTASLVDAVAEESGAPDIRDIIIGLKDNREFDQDYYQVAIGLL